MQGAGIRMMDRRSKEGKKISGKIKSWHSLRCRLVVFFHFQTQVPAAHVTLYYSIVLLIYVSTVRSRKGKAITSRTGPLWAWMAS